jgi:hypothetical protein
VGTGKHKVTVTEQQPKTNSLNKVFTSPTPVPNPGQKVIRQKITLPNLNPNNDETIIITTTKQSIYVVLKLSKSALSKTANLASQVKTSSGQDYVDSSYIFVDSIHLLNAPEGQNADEISNLLYLLELLSLRYPKETNSTGSTVFGDSWSYGVFKRLTQEIIDALGTSNKEKYKTIIESITQKSGGNHADTENGSEGRYYRPILKRSLAEKSLATAAAIMPNFNGVGGAISFGIGAG